MFLLRDDYERYWGARSSRHRQQISWEETGCACAP